ncbi:MAG: helix-turn-helix domain-containing protein [Lachnospiraceae bacterium]|nr:helix-turn-helix domain-containing protein [Lachnospiraceae bacterium]
MERLRELMDCLGITAAQLAPYAGFDRTNISRLRSGARMLAGSESPTAQKLSRGICLYARENGKLTELSSLISAGSAEISTDMEKTLLFWLTEKEGDPLPADEPAGNPSTFAERLNAVMRLTGVTGNGLSRLLNLDASLISRYRSGTRTPKNNPETAALLAEILWNRVLQMNQLKQLSEIMQHPADKIDDKAFLQWLCDFDVQRSGSISAAEKLLEAFNASAGIYDLPMSPIPEGRQESSSPEPGGSSVAQEQDYFGAAGLREAVARLLDGAITGKAKELWLYSDQNMSWMTGDPDFLRRWEALMARCVRQGIHIRIIHNIDRNLDEMTDAIRSWAPLYLSGMIESYYCRKERDRRFSHTIFLCPGFSCIFACHVSGMEQEGIYRYAVDRRLLNIWQSAYQKLLEQSRPLSRIVSVSSQTDTSTEILDYRFRQIHVRVDRESVLLSHDAQPQIAVCFTHPLLFRAFQAYGSSLPPRLSEHPCSTQADYILAR